MTFDSVTPLAPRTDRSRIAKTLLLALFVGMTFPALSCVLLWLGWALVKPNVWFMFYPATFLASWYRGMPACVIATLSSILLVNWYFVAPLYTFTLTDTAWLIPSSVFSIASLAIGAYLSRFRALKESLESTAQSLKHSKTELRKANHALRQTITEQEEQVRDAVRVKTEFLANMSHELRNPICAITLLANQLEEDEADGSERKVLLTRLQRVADTATALIDDILDYSRIDLHKIVLESLPFRLSDLCSRLNEIIEPSATSKGLSFSIDAPSFGEYIVGDMHRVQQILVNLLGNAIKFTETGYVNLRIRISEITSSDVSISFDVIDSGIGIKADDKERILKPFVQADTSITRQYGGSGLGLSISNNLLNFMGSGLTIDSTPGFGSTFSFKLKFDRNPSIASVTTEKSIVKATIKPLAGVRLLVVDDDEIIRLAMRDFLERNGAMVYTAKDGSEAVDFLRSQPSMCDLVFMDIQMPTMDGITATQVIRRELGHEHLPIIAVSAGLYPHQKDALLTIGVTQFLRKPVKPEKLIELALEYHSPAPHPSERSRREN